LEAVEVGGTVTTED